MPELRGVLQLPELHARYATAIFLVDEVLPQTARLSKALQAVQLDLSAISSLVDATLHILDAAMEPSANWILQLVDVKEELAATIGVNLVPDSGIH